MPETNDLFKGVNINRDRWLVRDVAGATGYLAAGADRTFDFKKFAVTVDAEPTIPGYPIIPLSDRLCKPIEIGPEDRPRPDLFSMDDFKRRVLNRAQTVADVLVDVDLRPFTDSMNRFSAFGLRLGARTLAARAATEIVAKKVDAALKDIKKVFE